MLNKGSSAETGFNTLVNTGMKMLAASVIAGVGAIVGGYVCAKLAARVGADIRKAIYKKSLDLSVYDFQTFGTASMTTRTVSDIVTVQFAVVGIFQMMLPVPVIFTAAVILSFMKDPLIGAVLLAVLTLIVAVAFFIMRSASPLFRRLQGLLDKMSTVLLENITGVRVVRAIVKNPQLYIFDDSFSALDFKTDAALRKALIKEKSDKAIVIIAQRVSSIQHADQIIVLNEGKPVGIGKHEELLKACEVYREIYDSQTKEADEI